MKLAVQLYLQTTSSNSNNNIMTIRDNNNNNSSSSIGEGDDDPESVTPPTTKTTANGDDDDDDDDPEITIPPKTTNTQQQHQDKKETIYPTVFYDPVSKELMKDPVVHPDGISYEKTTTDTVAYYPNRALQTIIEEDTERQKLKEQEEKDVSSRHSSIRSLRINFSKIQKSARQTINHMLDESPIPTVPSRHPSLESDALYCPITLDLIRYPVIDPSGTTFEKAAIEHWIDANHTSPLTRTPLQKSQLYENTSLRSYIEEQIESVGGGGQLSMNGQQQQQQQQQSSSIRTQHPSIRRWIEETQSHNPPTDSTRSYALPTTYDELERVQRQRRRANCTKWGFCTLIILIIWMVTFPVSFFTVFFVGCFLLAVAFGIALVTIALTFFFNNC
jgi:hypothetical protein